MHIKLQVELHIPPLNTNSFKGNCAHFTNYIFFATLKIETQNNKILMSLLQQTIYLSAIYCFQGEIKVLETCIKPLIVNSFGFFINYCTRPGCTGSVFLFLLSVMIFIYFNTTFGCYSYTL